MSSLHAALSALPNGPEIIEVLYDLSKEDVSHVARIMKFLVKHIGKGPHSETRASSIKSLIETIHPPSWYLREQLRECRSNRKNAKGYQTSRSASTMAFAQDLIAIKDPTWPLADFRESLEAWERESGHLMSYRVVEDKGAVLEGDIKGWTTVNVLEPVVDVMNNWLDHYLKKNPEKPKARLTFRGEYQPLDKTDPKQKKSKPKKKKLDKVDHAIMLHEGSNVPDKDRNSPAFDSDATPIVLWEDKILGALENEFEAHKKVYHHNPSTLPLTDTLGMCLPQVRKYVRISGVPYIILGDGRVITGMVWGTAGGDAGRTAGASFYRKWAEQDKTSEFLGKKSDTSERGEHICHALSTYSKAADSEEAVEEPSAGSIPTRELLAFFIWMALRDRGYLL